MCPFDDENDLRRLKPAAIALWHKHKAVEGELDEARARIQALEAELAAKTKKGGKGGKGAAKAGAAEAPSGPTPSASGASASAPSAPGKAPHVGHGPRPQPGLEARERTWDLDEADRVCRACGGGLEPFPEADEVAEEIDVEARRFVKRVHRRRAYRCRCGACIETAPGPDKLTAGGRYSVDFAVAVATAKYIDHQPLERQVRTMAREGLVVDSQTLWDQLDELGVWLRPAYVALRAYVLAQPVVGADETTWRLLGKGKQAGTWYVWLAHAERAVVYRLDKHRSEEAAAELLGEYAGVVMCDGYAAYLALAKKRPALVVAHCWAHVLRGFRDLESSFPKECGEVLLLIRSLYALEDGIRKGPEGDDERRRVRTTKSREVLDQIVAWVFATALTVPPGSGLAQAIAYMVKLWPGLVRFVDDPRIPLDNNGSERAARDAVLGRKNHYGSRSKRGTQVAAMLYSLVGSARLSGINPEAYLRVAALRAIRREPVLLPHELTPAVLAAYGVRGPPPATDA
ncbi:MAG TPA: IS66 family transposase [Polyangiaceae bacterium]|nr:IS66 family transposase [Polyangiaceae bacterium]